MKFSIYNVTINLDDGIIIYNTKCCKFITIFNNDDLQHYNELVQQQNLTNNDHMVQQLYKIGFIVDDDFDEYEYVKKQIEKIFAEKEKKLSLLIYVTEKCNFKCIYCPQKHEPKVFSEKNWNNLYNYIEKNVKNGNYRELSFLFFGGEPLLEKTAIVKFLTKINNLLKECTNISLYSSITTNAYLLSPQTYDELTSLGVVNFQITVDGFAETHNIMRPRTDGKETWDTIIENLKYINSKDDEVSIILRSNCNEINYNSLKDFFTWANNTFNNNKIVFDIEPVTKFSSNVKDNLVCNEEPDKIIEMIKSFDRYANTSDPRKRLLYLSQVCKYTEKNFYVVTVDGELVKCETAYNKNNLFVGHIENDNFILNENINTWINGFETEECKTCIIYPLCAARACPLRKVESSTERKDCIMHYDNVEEKITNLFKDGYMDKIMQAQRALRKSKDSDLAK